MLRGTAISRAIAEETSVPKMNGKAPNCSLTGSQSDWDPVNEQFGALPFIFGTLVSSAIALLIAVPLSIATAVYLTEIAPSGVRHALTLLVELLAAVPSVILGLWGLSLMV